MPDTDLDDAEVIRRARSDPGAFSALFDRHAPALHRYVTRRLGDSLADDVVAETFLAAFRRLGRYDTAYRDARPWLYGIAANLIGKHRRAELRAYQALTRSGTDEVAESYADRVEARVTAGPRTASWPARWRRCRRRTASIALGSRTSFAAAGLSVAPWARPLRCELFPRGESFGGPGRTGRGTGGVDRPLSQDRQAQGGRHGSAASIRSPAARRWAAIASAAAGPSPATTARTMASCSFRVSSAAPSRA